MFSDIVLPKDNEQKFLEIAEKIGIKKLYFAYDFNEFFGQNIQDKIDSIKSNKINFDAIFLANPANFNKAAKQSRALVAKSSDKDRFLIESRKLRIIYGFEELHKKDYLHQRASGLNHILCDLARKNNVAIGFSYSLLINKDNADSPLGALRALKGRGITPLANMGESAGLKIGGLKSGVFNPPIFNKKELAIIKGRMMQNIQLCHKYKVKTIITSFSSNPFELRAYHDVTSLFRLMGMNDLTIKDSFSYNL